MLKEFIVRQMLYYVFPLPARAIHNICYIFQTNPHPVVTQHQNSYSCFTPTPDTNGSIKIERLSVMNAGKLTLKVIFEMHIII